MSGPRLEMRDVSKEFRVPGRPPLRAVDGVSLRFDEGETLGLAGESGCGKSTTALLLAGLLEPTRGEVLVDAAPWPRRPRDRQAVRRQIQIILQQPDASLDPRLHVGAIVAEGLRIHDLVPAARLDAEVGTLLQAVGLDGTLARRYPHELSGGQRQRVAIARALAVRPRLLLADEPFAALDVCAQVQIVELLRTLRHDRGLTLLLISHDLRLLARTCDRVAVMYLGRLVEVGPTRSVLTRPRHPYTDALLAAIPRLDRPAPSNRGLPGEPPAAGPAAGCPLQPRCPLRVDRCAQEAPILRELTPGHWASCHLTEPHLPDGRPTGAPGA